MFLVLYGLLATSLVLAGGLDATSPIVQKLGTEQQYELVRSPESASSCWENLHIKLKVESNLGSYTFQVSEYLGFDNDGVPPVNYDCSSSGPYFCITNLMSKNLFGNAIQASMESVHNEQTVLAGDPIGCHQYGDIYELDMCDPTSPLIYAATKEVGVNSSDLSIQFSATSTGHTIRMFGATTEFDLKLDSNGKGYFEQKSSICNYSLDG